MTFQVLLYYKYIKIDNPEELLKQHQKLCKELELTGRIIIAGEGINGTIEGLVENCQKYQNWLVSLAPFADIEFKVSKSDGQAFPKLSIKVRTEIVAGHTKINPNATTGKYLSPTELQNWFETGKEFYIIDMRNDYEHQSGHFQNSILPKLGHFRDLPKILPSIEHLKDKTVVSVCTGGIRCETASGFLISNGFVDVWQLKGGIFRYLEEFPSQYFLGKMYVFDGRMLLSFGQKSIGKCQICGTHSENYVNIANGRREHIICCENCIAQGKMTLQT
jgi:UPF0176 protein